MVAATHKKLEKAADVTSTKIVTCMINKWRVKINKNEVYNVRNPPGERDQKIDLGKTVVVRTILKSSCNHALKKQ